MNMKRIVCLVFAVCAVAAACGEAEVTPEAPAQAHADADNPSRVLQQLPARRADARSKLPPIDPENADHCMRPHVELDLPTWVEAADALVVGTVVEVSGTTDYGYRDEPYERRGIYPAEQCASLYMGFRVVLEDIVTLAGTPIERAEVRFGERIRDVWPLRSQPVVRGEEVRWWDEAEGRIEPGMRIGGALFYDAEFDMYSFEQNVGQVMFEVLEDGVIAFQDIVNPTCRGMLPPVSTLHGVTLDELTSQVRQAGEQVDSSTRQDNMVRQYIRADLPLRESHSRAKSWFANCLPNDMVMVEEEPPFVFPGE